MSYGFSQPAPPSRNQVIRRPLTQEELTIGLKSYGGFQNSLRGLGIISLLLAIVTFYLYWEYIIDWSISLTLNLITLIFGLISLGMAINSFSTRKKLESTIQNGYGIEVRAPAYRNNQIAGQMPMKGKLQSWNVGPISILSTGEVEGMVHEGVHVCILCIPRMNVALSINGVPLRNIVPVVCSPNLENMATDDIAPSPQYYQP
jgi:hypothetical protein